MAEADGNFGGNRNQLENEAAQEIAESFAKSPIPLQTKLAQCAKYMRRQDLTRLIARYELFKKVLPVKGSIVECGVFHGAGIMTWANLSAVLEPNNIMRKIYGFDTFGGFPSVAAEDNQGSRSSQSGDLKADVYEELLGLVRSYDKNRFLGHLNKVELIKGDATQTIPSFIQENSHLVVAMLFLDFDLYEPTKVALQHFLPRMPKGSILAFDEIDHPAWPGETLAALEICGLKNLRLERLDFEPYIGYAVLE